MKIAIIGTGAAAFGTLLSLSKRQAGLDIDLFRWETQFASLPCGTRDQSEWTSADYDALHEQIRAAVGLKFPPPKSHFGELVPTHQSATRTSLWRSATEGGLTKNWSASLFPFTDDDFAGWPIDSADLAPFYRQIADEVGIAGRDDALSDHFGSGFVNRPSIKVANIVEKFIRAVNDHGSKSGFSAGVNRVGIETRRGNDGACVACGGCFYGCTKGSVFNAGTAIRKLLARDGALRPRIIDARVLKIESGTKRGGTIHTVDDRFTGYDRIFCAAGCLGSSEIALRSDWGAGKPLIVGDNRIHIFPVMHPLGAWSGADDYVAIANAVIGSGAPGEPYCEAHVAPLPDYLLRFLAPSPAWPLVRHASRILRHHVMFGKFYMDGAASPRHELALGANGNLEIHTGPAPERQDDGKKRLAKLARAVLKEGFILPYPAAFPSGTSSHYAGSLSAHIPAGNRLGEIVPGLHVVDSSIFPTSPAQPLTFTIMANAARIAAEVADVG